jgi:hypothetical protein
VKSYNPKPIPYIVLGRVTLAASSPPAAVQVQVARRAALHFPLFHCCMNRKIECAVGCQERQQGPVQALDKYSICVCSMKNSASNCSSSLTVVLFNNQMNWFGMAWREEAGCFSKTPQKESKETAKPSL